ncbi:MULTISPECIES: AraC family transcriptional regulator [unclassified Dietzia]|uniref:AraC family transcriptional regulator n=1 Tax=unclassified Dietzia TaxID=2617939 RepID=UPI0015F9CD04|nr:MULTISPECIES: AraC family transcriptional regulator [unclassified Dietzia]
MQPLIRTASLRGFAPLVSELGGDPEHLLDQYGIAAEALAGDDGLISITAHDQMLDAAAAALECPDFGLRLADRQDISILGPVARAIRPSSTATEALECAARFLFVHSPALTIGVDDDPWNRRGVIALTYRKQLSESPYSPQAIELGLGLFHRMAVQLLGRSPGLRSVELTHGPLSPVDRYLDFFGADIKFDRPVAALCVERRILDASFATADEEIRQAALDHLAGTYSDPAHSMAGRVRRAVGERLPGRVPALAEVAASLAIHPRTLQRHLVVEDTTYGRVVDDLRRDRAHRFITTTDLSFTQIADLVGFSEQSTLSHAVRRWFGVSPGELRRRGRVSR